MKAAASKMILGSKASAHSDFKLLRKKMKLSFNHFFGQKKYVYYGYIKPTKEHLIKFQNNLNIFIK